MIFGAFGLLAALIFGLIYLFVLAPTVPGGSFGWYLFSFAVGLTMIVMPCTLPLAFVIVPLSMGKGVAKGLGMALAFGLGVAVMLSTYGIAAALLGGFALEFLGSDVESIKNWVYFIAGIFAFTFALGELGLINVHMPTYSGAAPAFIQKRGELIKAFLLGLFLGNVGVGCPHPATPLILIEIASSGDILYGWTMFLVHAIGRVIPLLLLAFLAILGVNGLNWLMTRKATVERVTGWGMVFVAGFILTLGLFTHDWWVNSGLHSALEAVTQEGKFNAWFNEALDQEVAHEHGPEIGQGLFGLPLELGHWFLVLVWLIPIWWWWLKKRKTLRETPAFALVRLQHEFDKVEDQIRSVEASVNLDDVDGKSDIAALEAELDRIKKERRKAAKLANYGETGPLKEETARKYESKILGMHRNYLIIISLFLVLVFAHFMPSNFFYKSTNPNISDGHGDHAHDAGAAGMQALPDGTIVDGNGSVVPGAHMMGDGTIMLPDGTTVAGSGRMMHQGETFARSVTGLPNAVAPETVYLSDGDEYEIVAEYVKKEVGNRTLRMMAYNRSVPGPFIRADEGSEVTIKFTNLTDLDQTIHSHGIRVDNLNDGVPYVTQDPVPPGGTYTYTINFRDGGVSWYHPHTRDDYGQELGLYGNYIVEPSSGYPSSVNREVPLVIDDILIENDQIVEFYKDLTTFALLGRFGNEYLVNGEQNYTITAQTGEVIRFMVTNVSNARTYNLSIPGVDTKLVAADLGQYERQEFVDDVLISPAERMVVEAHFEEPGVYQVMHTMPSGEVELARVLVTDETVATSYAEEFKTLYSNEEVVSAFVDFRDYHNAVPDKKLLLSVEISGEMDHSGHAHGDSEANDSHAHGAAETNDAHDHGSAGMMDHSEHAHSQTGGDRLDTIQWDDPTQSDFMSTSNNVEWKLIDQDTGKVSMDIDDWVFKQGDLVKVRLTNDVEADHVMQHPIHFHGQRFVVLSENGVRNDNLAWKDTVLVFPNEYVDILIEMSNPGEWMNHCHISEHLHAGMMMQFRVEDESGSAPGDEYRSTVPADAHASPEQSDNAATSPMPNQANMQTIEPKQTYSFDDTDKVDGVYKVEPGTKIFRAGRVVDVPLSFTDIAGNPVNLSDEAEVALVVTFVNSDDSISFVTYPGNTVFPKTQQPVESMQDDGHDHEHSFLTVPVAHAHGDAIQDGHHEGSVGRTYTVPAQFPKRDVYRGYVEFILNGETEPRTAYFDVEISEGFSLNDFGWSGTTKWLVLVIGSLILMVPLTLGVRRYISVEKMKTNTNV